jgi:hypothetical protein
MNEPIAMRDVLKRRLGKLLSFDSQMGASLRDEV